MTSLREAAEQALILLKQIENVEDDIYGFLRRAALTSNFYEVLDTLRAALAEPPRKTTCVYPQCVSTTRTQCDAWASGACDRET